MDLFQINSSFEVKEYINQLSGIDVNILFSVIFTYGKICQLIIRTGDIPANTDVSVATLPNNYVPRHNVYGSPIIGVPNGSGNNYLLRVHIIDGNIVISNHTDYYATESYIDIMYFING